MEGMDTSGVFRVVLPSRGNADLQNFQTGLTGDGGVEYGQSNVNDSELTDDGNSIDGYYLTTKNYHYRVIHNHQLTQRVSFLHG